MSTYKFSILLNDVWGNAEDGFEVNDARRIGTITLSEEDTDEQILAKIAKEIGGNPKLYEIDDQGDFSCLGINLLENGSPDFTLQMTAEDSQRYYNK